MAPNSLSPKTIFPPPSKLSFIRLTFFIAVVVCFSFLYICLEYLKTQFAKPKMSNFRLAGLNYVQYSNIAARMLRRALKAEKRADAAKREESHVRITQWKDGRPATAGESKVKA